MSENNNPRNGYEMRTDLLGMSIGILESRNARMAENEHLKPEGQRAPVVPYTTEDVMQTAEQLYSFVEKNKG